MSTRSKTRLAAAVASTSKVISLPPTKQERKSKSRSRKSESEDKENVKGKESTVTPTAPSAKKKSVGSNGRVYCNCQKGDDGTPMVLCEECKLWYHFSCVNLKEEDADDINVYICPTCTKISGRRTAMHWEGLGALEEVSETESITAPVLKKQKRIRRDNPLEELPSESEEDPSSADEYVGDNLNAKGKGKRSARRLSYSSDSDPDVSDEQKPSRRHRIRKRSTPPPGGGVKRKSRTSQTPPQKRLKTDDVSSTSDDPTRKYCLGKLEELFRGVFLRYPHVRIESQESGDQNKVSESGVIQKPLDDLTEDEKTELLNESRRFAEELEKAMFEIYSEPDKQGHSSAGSKYKDRFRMLQFNLSKPDRVVLHQRIVSAGITAEEISLMSSTDLANEETKQSIKIAEKEALEHSILTPTTVPRAKITHKGLEDIEDIHGNVVNVQDEERSHLEEERRERERMARLRSQTRQRATSTSVPPESPIASQQTPTWGGPPPVPLHAISTEEATADSTSSFATSAPPLPPVVHDTITAEPELALADLIHLEDDSPNVAEDGTKPHPDRLLMTEAPMSISPDQADLSPVSQTGISPFAAKQDPPWPSFNLDALWNTPKVDESITPVSLPPPQQQQLTSSPKQIKVDEKDIIMESDTAVAEDQDFDMFLDEKLDSAMASAEAQQVALDALPRVWTGKINMPLDSTIPQETPVVARQVGGRPIAHDSTLWKTLFPSELLRIDGRVPVENSSKFLLQMRMNVAKELISVAFSPTSESSDVGFRILSDFLIAKGRHGLVFPWGNRPKDYHPGRELYIIPLLSSDPLPEYMELLDDLHLPKLRLANLLIGIWILNKGKLASPPPPPPPVPAFPLIPPNVQLPMSKVPPTPSLPPPPPLPANIAAEVASLSPEQIQLMIRTITGSGSISLPIPQPPQLPPQPPLQVPPIHPPVPIPSVAPPQWSNPIQGYGAMYPPNPESPSHHSPSPHQTPYDRRDSRELRFRSGGERDDRGGRGWRGRGRGRFGGNDGPRKPVDSGWPRKPRH